MILSKVISLIEALAPDRLFRHEVRPVINFAANSHVDRLIADPGALVHTNVVCTFAMLDAGRIYRQSLKGWRNIDIVGLSKFQPTKATFA